MPQHAEQKIGGGFLFEFQPVANTVGSIQQHSNAQRQIRLLREVSDFLGSLLIKNLEIVFFQCGHQLVAPVQHRKQNIDEVDAALDYRGILAGRLFLRAIGGGGCAGGPGSCPRSESGSIDTPRIARAKTNIGLRSMFPDYRYPASAASILPGSSPAAFESRYRNSRSSDRQRSTQFDFLSCPRMRKN